MGRKSWNQLSILQLFMGMAVLAMFISLNSSIGYDSRRDDDFLISGWPFTWLSGPGVYYEEPVFGDGYPIRNTIALTLNFVCCIVAMLAAVKATGLLVNGRSIHDRT